LKAPGKARPPRRRRGFEDGDSFAAAGTRSDHVQSPARALGIINQLASAEEGMTLTHVAECMGLPPSTAHRLLTTLEQERYVHFDHERRLWSVGCRRS
jgi:ATP-dependent exoDNAse (exonuclease V) alpha subunit